MSQRGFSLLEVVLAIVVVGVVATHMATMANSLVRATNPVRMVQQGLLGSAVLERMHLAVLGGTNLNALKGQAGSGNQNNQFGSYVLQEARFVKFDNAGDMQDAQPGDPKDILYIRIAEADGGSIGRLFIAPAGP